MGSWPVGYSSSQAAMLARKEAEKAQKEKDATKIKISTTAHQTKAKIDTLIQKK